MCKIVKLDYNEDFFVFIVIVGNILYLYPQAFQQKEFIIGTCVDPKLSTKIDTCDSEQVNRDIDSYKLAKDAYFNLLTGFQNSSHIVNTFEGMNYALYIANKVGLKYMVRDSHIANLSNSKKVKDVVDRYKKLPENLRKTMFGYNIKDEPNMEDTHIIGCVKEISKCDPTKLAYINLLPVYGFQTAKAYEEYLDTFINIEGSAVVSYDNYCVNKNYYYNLKIIKSKAGDKPFWAYPNATHIVSGFPKPTVSSLCLQSFAPLAYGAKGLIYFAYEAYPRFFVDYCRNGNGWDLNGCYLNDSVYSAICDYDNDGKADLGVKTYTGKWLVNYSEDGLEDGWDATFNHYGGKEARPVPADYDGDRKTDLSVKTDSGEWLINYASDGFDDGWDVSLKDYGGKEAHPVPADYDGDGKADLSVKTDGGEWLINYAIDGLGDSWDVVSLYESVPSLRVRNHSIDISENLNEKNYVYAIYSLMGTKIKDVNQLINMTELRKSNIVLPPGIYLIKIRKNHLTKFVKVFL